MATVQRATDISLYGDYCKAPNYNNLEVASAMLRQASDALKEIKSGRLISMQLVVRDDTVGWKFEIKEGEQ